MAVPFHPPPPLALGLVFSGVAGRHGGVRVGHTACGRHPSWAFVGLLLQRKLSSVPLPWPRPCWPLLEVFSPPTVDPGHELLSLLHLRG